MTAGATTVSAPNMVGRRAVASDRKVAAAPVEAPDDEPETWGDRVYAVLPLFIVGGACLFVAFDLYYAGATSLFGGPSSVRFSPWALFFALAVIGLGAGTFALFFEEEAAEPVTATASPAPARPAPVWDESTIAPTKPTYVRPRTWERYPELPEEVGWSPAESRAEALPPDLVLIQIDEIAASLRKKTPPPETP